MRVRPTNLLLIHRQKGDPSRWVSAVVCATALLICADGVRAAIMTADEPAAAETNTDSSPTISMDEVTTEVVRFVVTGDKPWQRLAVDDLDVLLTRDGRRMLPLRRLIGLMDAKSEEHDGQITFQFDGGPLATLQISSGHLQFNGTQIDVPVAAIVSQITDEPELYVPADVAGKLMALELVWNEMGYIYIVRTDRALHIWKAPERPALMGVRVAPIPTQLPSVLPAAYPPDFSVDYIDVQLQIKGDVVRPDNQPAELELGSLQQTFWGRLAGGGYKLRLSQPGVAWDSQQGINITDESSDAVRLDYVDWIYAWDRGEVGIGDSNYGLNDLVFPYVQFTGIRISGVAGPGWDTQSLDWKHGDYSNAILRTQTFNGVAPVGSRVDLLINGQLVNTDDVLSIDPNAPAGFGLWEFEDIHLPPGALNEIRIRVTDPNGVMTQITREVLGTSLMLPPGGVAYVGGIGAQRNVQRFEVGGLFAGGRVVVGLTDRLTVGTVVGYQDRFHQFFDPASDKPISSTHVGGEAFWMPTDKLMVITDIATAMSELPGGGSQDDVAAVVRTDLHITRPLALGSSMFYYGPKYFNGQTTSPSDRMGLWVSGKWYAKSMVSVMALAGWARDNVGGDADQTLGVSFQALHVTSSPLRGYSVGYTLDRVAPDNNESARMLHTLELDASPMPRLDVSATWALGEDVALAGDGDDFFDGLNIPYLDVGQTAQQTARARYQLGAAHSIGMAYFKSGSEQRASLLHDLRTLKPPYLIFHTELGRDIETATVFFENRSDWLFDRHGDWRLGFRARLDEQEWNVGIFFSITDQFIFHNGQMMRTAEVVPDRLYYGGVIDPDFGGAVTGRVFIDADADGVIDNGEPGLAGVRVIAEQLDESITDKAGRYVIPRLDYSRRIHVWLDVDTIPAIYTPTHAIQDVVVRPRSLTTVNLGVSPSHSVFGKLCVLRADGTIGTLSGVRVRLERAIDEKTVADSITATDGSYYLGDLRPGRYDLKIDAATVPLMLNWPDLPGDIVIEPSIEPAEVELPPLVFVGWVESRVVSEEGPAAAEQPVTPEVLVPELDAVPFSPARPSETPAGP